MLILYENCRQLSAACQLLVSRAVGLHDSEYVAMDRVSSWTTLYFSILKFCQGEKKIKVESYNMNITIYTI